jgi:AcrR family transcriptional regulator
MDKANHPTRPKTQRHPDARGDGSARERILKSAEQIFADMGFEGTSLRQVAVNADVPVALVSYHFKNKLGLYREVFRSRDPNTNVQRLAGLALAETESDLDRRLEMIVKAVMMPMLSLRKVEGSANFGVLLTREATDPRLGERGIINEMFDPVAKATIKALKGALPGRSEAEIIWGFQMMIGTILYIMADAGRAAHLSNGACDPEDVDGTVRMILPLLLHGIRGAAI